MLALVLLAMFLLDWGGSNPTISFGRLLAAISSRRSMVVFVVILADAVTGVIDFADIVAEKARGKCSLLLYSLLTGSRGPQRNRLHQMGGGYNQ